MAKIEFALISALYDSKGADLYTEIYFPIIKYSMVEMYYDQNGKQKYFDLNGLQSKIESLFGISIPLLVLRQCAKALEKKQEGVSLRYYEDNQLLKINGVWDFSINETIAEKANSIRQRYQQLELMFQRYLSLEQLDCDKTFFDFFSDYAEESLLFANQESSDVIIDENYANLTNFIQWLNDNDTEMFSLIGEVLWGAIISGFLRRKNVDLGLKASEKEDYYLDSSLVLSILGLDSKENVSYAKEMLEIIKQANSRPLVHPLTLREIDRILEQVELQQEARPGSAIASAFEWQEDMSLSKILNIRNRIVSILDTYKIFIPNVSTAELDSIEEKYRTNNDVKALAQERGNGHSLDMFREIHDIYMCEMVMKSNRYKSTSEKFDVFFVTLNRGLITMMSDKTNASCIIHSGNIVLNLWLHSSRSSILKKSALISVVSRSLAMNKMDVRRRLHRLQKILISADIPEKDVKCMYKALLKRSEKTINNVDSLLEKSDDLENNERNKYVKAIAEAARDEEEERKKSRMEDEANIHRLLEEVESTKKALSDVQQGKLKDEEAIQILTEQVDSAKKNQEEYQKQINELSQKLETQTKLNGLTQTLAEKKQEKHDLEEKRQKSVNYFKYWLILIIELLCVLLLLVFLVLLCINWDKSNIFTKNFESNIEYFIGLVVFFMGLVLRLKDMYILTPRVKKMNHREEQLASWDDRHPEYGVLLKEIYELEQQIKDNSQI